MSNKTVFISYSSKDRKKVNEIVKIIEGMGIKCWKAPEGIPAGSSYAREIPKAISGCAVFLLMLSKTAQDSIWVEKETDNAISNRKNIIPLLLDDEPLNDAFHFYLNNVQMISYYEDESLGIEELKRQLSMHILGKTYETKQSISVTAQEEVSKNQKKMSISGSNKSMVSRNQKINALRVNRIPVCCAACGGRKLTFETLGIYICEDCGKENYDDFQTIRNYLDKVGSASALEIERVTGVPRNIVKHFFRDEFLEIPLGSPTTVTCEKCGAPIRTGIYCTNCKNTMNETGKRNSSRGGMSGSWHT